MPLYEYECARHGAFELSRKMSESSSDAPCPTCKRGARRILSLPSLAQVAGSERKARDRNERSRHEPRIVSKRAEPARDGPPKLVAASSCGRPWAIGH
ncbi:MAG TPA: zinc ribbon domain-containing protein [Polyangiaceae bacterium]|jgi:putative FmdB family regulatory protein|nr:zinc ribbon domain-containing protein [Polyangiaceae bacterium]